MLRDLVAALVLLVSLQSAPAVDRPPEPLRIAVIGLVHGHVEGVLWNARERKDLEIVGVHDPDRELFDRFAAKYGLDASL